jgi:hypothetical protein
MTNIKNTGRNTPFALGLALALGLLINGCGSSSSPRTSTGGAGGDETGGSSGGDTGGKTGSTGGSTGSTGGSTGSTGGSTGSTGGSTGSTGGSGGADTGGSGGGGSGGSGGSTQADAGTKADGGGAGGSTGSHAVTPDNALVMCKTTAKYRLPGASPTDFCNFYEKYCPYAPSQPPRDITPPTPATSAYFQDYNDCIMRYTMAPPESQSCRAGQLCGTNFMQKPIGQGCTHATGHFDGPCYAK